LAPLPKGLSNTRYRISYSGTNPFKDVFAQLCEDRVETRIDTDKISELFDGTFYVEILLDQHDAF